MKCIKCKGKTGVAETFKNTSDILRKRKCLECGTLFITREIIDNGEDMMRMFNMCRKGLKV